VPLNAGILDGYEGNKKGNENQARGDRNDEPPTLTQRVEIKVSRQIIDAISPTQLDHASST
jgi:hypothetical protein